MNFQSSNKNLRIAFKLFRFHREHFGFHRRFFKSQQKNVQAPSTNVQILHNQHNFGYIPCPYLQYSNTSKMLMTFYYVYSPPQEFKIKAEEAARTAEEFTKLYYDSVDKKRNVRAHFFELILECIRFFEIIEIVEANRHFSNDYFSNYLDYISTMH